MKERLRDNNYPKFSFTHFTPQQTLMQQKGKDRRRKSKKKKQKRTKKKRAKKKRAKKKGKKIKRMIIVKERESQKIVKEQEQKYIRK